MTAAVVGAFGPGDDRQAEFVTGGPASVVEDVLAQEREERLHRGVVGTRGDPAHRAGQAVPVEVGDVGPGAD